MKKKKTEEDNGKVKKVPLSDKAYYENIAKTYDKFMINAFGIINKIIRGELILFAGRATGDIYFINREYVKKLEEIRGEETPDRVQEYLEKNGIPHILSTYIMRSMQGFSKMDPYSYKEMKGELMEALIKNAFIMEQSDGALSFLKSII